MQYTITHPMEPTPTPAPTDVPAPKETVFVTVPPDSGTTHTQWNQAPAQPHSNDGGLFGSYRNGGVEKVVKGEAATAQTVGTGSGLDWLWNGGTIIATAILGAIVIGIMISAFHYSVNPDAREAPKRALNWGATQFIVGVVIAASLSLAFIAIAMKAMGGFTHAIGL